MVRTIRIGNKRFKEIARLSKGAGVFTSVPLFRVGKGKTIYVIEVNKKKKLFAVPFAVLTKKGADSL